MSDEGRYRAGTFSDPAKEIERLQMQARFIAAREQAALLRVGLPLEGLGLDVGCGPGFFADGLQREHPGLEITGMDIDPIAVAEARRRLKTAIRGDINAMPFGIERFDFAYARLFLRHLPDPGLALAEIAACVKIGGRILAIDSADASLLLDPMPDGFKAVVSGRRQWFAERGCDGSIGYKLPGLFARSGLKDLAVETVVVDTQSVGREAFSKIALAPFLHAAEAVLGAGPHMVYATEAVERWAQAEDSFGTITLFIVGGST